MSNIIRFCLLIVLLAVSPCLRARQSGESQNFALSLADSYQPWTSVMLTGKLSSENLPVSPSVRIYMERDKRIMISIRAILFGEVGRVEIDGNTLLAVNKIKKVYVRQDLTSLFSRFPLTVGNVQDIFLGRVFLTGFGTLSRENFAMADFNYSQEDNMWDVLPLEMPYAGTAYFFRCFSDGTLDSLVASYGENYGAAVAYDFSGNGIEEGFYVGIDGKEIEATLKFGAPSWNAKPLESMEKNIDKKYKKVGFRDFLKSLSL